MACWKLSLLVHTPHFNTVERPWLFPFQGDILRSITRVAIDHFSLFNAFRCVGMSTKFESYGGIHIRQNSLDSKIRDLLHGAWMITMIAVNEGASTWVRIISFQARPGTIELPGYESIRLIRYPKFDRLESTTHLIPLLYCSNSGLDMEMLPERSSSPQRSLQVE